MTDRWWTSPAEGEHGGTVMVTGRDYLEKIIEGGKFPYRVEVSWDYEADPSGMPREEEALMMEKVTEALISTFAKDKIAYLTGIYTGEGRRDWVFYTRSLPIFGKVFNRALEDLDTIPIRIDALSDPEWEEYRRMREISYIPPDADEI